MISPPSCSFRSLDRPAYDSVTFCPLQHRVLEILGLPQSWAPTVPFNIRVHTSFPLKAWMPGSRSLPRIQTTLIPFSNFRNRKSLKHIINPKCVLKDKHFWNSFPLKSMLVQFVPDCFAGTRSETFPKQLLFYSMESKYRLGLGWSPHYIKFNFKIANDFDRHIQT